MTSAPSFHLPRHWVLALALIATTAACGDDDPGTVSGKTSTLARPSPSSSTRASAYGHNLLQNPSFDQAVILGTLPQAPGNWRGDLAAVVHAELGIVPHSGATMLKFLATGALPSAVTLTSSLWQVIEVGAFAKAIAAGGVRASAGVWFNRIDAGEDTDRRFDLRVLAFDGNPSDLVTRYATSSWLAEETAPLVSTAHKWQRVGASLVLPPRTSYLLVEIVASEDMLNDAESPEFAGHYADELSLVLTPGG